jgi:YidC/Oxa1 family membrane protein insertase
MFTTFIVQPIFNILATIYALLPGHNFGLALIFFTILTRVALFPLLKKQLRHSKAMREMQPELKRIKEVAKGNRQQESMMMMELYREKQIKPLSFIGLMVVQIVLFLALFSGINRIVKNNSTIVSFSYPVVQNLSWMEEVRADTSKFDNTLVGAVDLDKPAINQDGNFYLPALLLVLGSSIIQYLQIRQTTPRGKDAKRVRDILREANNGKMADSAEMNAAMGRNMSYVLPVFIFVITIGFPAALSLYWFVGGLIAFLQQSYLLKQDEYSMEVIASSKPRVVVTTRTETIKTRAKKATSSKKQIPKEAEIVKHAPKKSSKKRKR